MTKDKDIKGTEWARYLKKYASRYRAFNAEDNIWKLKCKYGHVEPNSLENQKLCFYGDSLSSKRKTYFCSRLPEYAEITQDGETEGVIVFPEKKLDSMAVTLNLYRKRKISVETKARLIEQLKKANEVGRK